MTTLHNDYAAAGLQVLTVAVEDSTHNSVSAEEAEAWKERYFMDHPVLIDDGAVYADYSLHTSQFPLVLLIDRDMTVLEYGTGYNNFQDIAKAIPGLL